MFNLENKVTFNELSPSLQALINSKATITQVNEAESIMNKIINQIGSVRITIASTAPSGPIEKNDIFFCTNNAVMYSFYNNAWNSFGGVYV